MSQQDNRIYYQWLYILTGLAVLLNLSGLFITIIGPDGDNYAGIAKTMVQRHDYVNLYSAGKDFLDKPHFPFWITAIFFELFGFTTWAYKLPGVLCMLLGAGYTYRFAKALYNQEVALWSVLILLTAQHIIISNNDVRAEPYLTGLIIAAIYHYYRINAGGTWWHLILGSLFTALAIMTKGMFALVPIGGAIAGHLLITSDWRRLFQWRWMATIMLTGIFILPELWCLYQQFDLHPEKLIFDRHHVSGIRFFFWDSQFGRFFNTGPIKGSGDPFFFVHTLAWAFLPWSLLLFAAVYQSIKKQVNGAMSRQWYCLCGALLTFLLFSASKFQLPYYLNIVFPLFAIQLAAYLQGIQNLKSKYAVQQVQSAVVILMLVIIVVLQYFFKAPLYWPVIVTLLALIILMMTIPRQVAHGDVRKALLRTVIAAFIVNLYFNLSFYPTLLKYQGGSEAAFYINKINTQHYPVVQAGDEYNFPLGFYIKDKLLFTGVDNAWRLPKPFYLVATKAVVNQFKNPREHVAPIKDFSNYWVSMLKPRFINYKTRAGTLDTLRVTLVK